MLRVCVNAELYLVNAVLLLADGLYAFLDGTLGCVRELEVLLLLG